MRNRLKRRNKTPINDTRADDARAYDARAYDARAYDDRTQLGPGYDGRAKGTSL